MYYGIQLWGSASQKVIAKTIILQKRAVRIINNAPYNSHTEPLFKVNRILKLKDLWEYQIVLFMYDFVNNYLPQSFNNMFQLNLDINPDRITRQSSDLYMPKFKNMFVSKLPPFHFPKVWNHWKSKLDYNMPRHAFKSSLKQYILSSYSSQIKCMYSGCKECNSI